MYARCVRTIKCPPFAPAPAPPTPEFIPLVRAELHPAGGGPQNGEHDQPLKADYGGMSLAVITGHCYQSLWAQIGNSAPIAEAATVMLGVRDLDPAEQERFERSDIQMVNWHQGKPQADVHAALDQPAKSVKEVYLHLDFDALDPVVAPGIVDPPVPGGLSLQDTEEAIRAVAARFRIRAATLAAYNPDLDQDQKTLRAGLRIMELLTECARDQG